MKQNRKALLRAVLAMSFLSLGMVPLLLLAAGRIDYWQAWVYGGVNLAVQAATWLVLRRHEDLIEERTRPGPGAKGWDKVYLAASSPLYFIAVFLSAVDAGRFGWSPPLPAPVYAAALLLYLAGQALFLRARQVNRYFSTVVRIQLERGQRVCDRGPYRVVRHPGYAAGILMMLTPPLLLGSLWGCLPQALAVIMLLVRTELEDRTLRRELPGYREYARRVRYRLVPLVW